MKTNATMSKREAKRLDAAIEKAIENGYYTNTEITIPNRPKCTVFSCKHLADIKIGISYLCADHAVELGYINIYGEPLDGRVFSLWNKSSADA